MNNKYLPTLIKMAREDLPALQFDLQNASTHFALQAATQKMFEVLGLVLHHTILESIANNQAPNSAPDASSTTATPNQPSQPVRSVPARILPRSTPSSLPQRIIPQSAFDLPPPPTMSAPVVNPALTPSSSLADAPAAQPGVLNVTITTQGTRVTTPAGTQAVLAPGEPVTSDVVSDTPELPPPPEDGVNVVLPPGGGMSPEIEAALAGRSRT
jgi:hypothetical protein